MWAVILSLFAKGNGAKLGMATAGGTSLLTLVFALHGDLSGKIKEQKEEQREYVELVLRPINIEIKNQNSEIKETKELVRDIHNYLLKRK